VLDVAAESGGGVAVSSAASVPVATAKAQGA